MQPIRVQYVCFLRWKFEAKCRRYSGKPPCLWSRFQTLSSLAVFEAKWIPLRWHFCVIWNFFSRNIDKRNVSNSETFLARIFVNLKKRQKANKYFFLIFDWKCMLWKSHILVYVRFKSNNHIRYSGINCNEWYQYKIGEFFLLWNVHQK